MQLWFIELAFQLSDFLEIDPPHPYAGIVEVGTREIVEHITSTNDRPSTLKKNRSEQSEETGRYRSRSLQADSDDEAAYPTDWAIHRPDFRAAVKRFEQGVPNQSLPSPLGKTIGTKKVNPKVKPKQTAPERKGEPKDQPASSDQSRHTTVSSPPDENDQLEEFRFSTGTRPGSLTRPTTAVTEEIGEQELERVTPASEAEVVDPDPKGKRREFNPRVNPTIPPFTMSGDRSRSQASGASGLTEAQRQEMIEIVTAAIRADRSSNPQGMRGAQGFPGPPGAPGPAGPPGQDGLDGTGGITSTTVKPDDIGYFDPDLDEPKEGPVVNVGRHTFYRDVYAFTDRVKDIASLHTGMEAAIRQVIPMCFRGSALQWHSVELTELEKDLMREAPLTVWYSTLIKRFKERGSVALQKLQTKRFTMADAREGKTPRAYAQEMFQHAKAAELTSVYNQITIAWNNLSLEFRLHVPEPTPATTMAQFLDQLDGQASLWHELARRTGGQPGSNLSRGSNTRSASKPQGRRGGYNQPPQPNSPYYQPPRQPWYSQSANYQNQYANPPQQQQPPRTIPPGRTPLQITGGNASPSPNYPPNARNFPPRGRGNTVRGRGLPNRQWQWQQPRQGVAAYNAVEEEPPVVYDEANTVDESVTSGYVDGDEGGEPSGYYASDPNIDYYEPESYNQPSEADESNEPVAQLTTVEAIETIQTPRIKCRRCKNTFESNNRLHHHLRNTCLKGKPTAFATDVPNEVVSRNHSTTPSDTTVLPVAISTAPAVGEVGTGFGFRNWHYATTKVHLTQQAALEDICLDTGCSVTLIDREFLRDQIPTKPVRTMASPIQVRGIGSNKHSTDEYVILDMFVPGVNDNGPVEAKITREAHVVDGLKAKMLVGMDIMGPEKIDIIVSTKQAYIGSCKVTIPIEIRPRSSQQVRQIVHAKTAMTIPPGQQIQIPVQHIELPDRDFLFEPSNAAGISLFAHLADQSFDSVLARNDSNSTIKIARNYNLGILAEVDYDNCYLAEAIEDLAMQQPKSAHQESWIKRVFAACGTAMMVAPSIATPDQYGTASTTAISTVLPETILPNGVTVHGNANEVNRLTEVVNEFPELWFDNGKFAELPMSEWMQIPLKPGWEDRISGKAKVYPVGTRDREVIDTTFDALHNQGRLHWTKVSTPFSYPVFVVWKAMPDGAKKGRVVVDIRGLNQLAQPDAYPLPLQSDIIAAVRDCKYITVVDCSAFFYQWRVHPQDRHKLTVVTHRGQESFNVAVMGYKNSPAYVQRQIDRILRPFGFARAFVDDVVISSKSLDEHVRHLRSVFGTFSSKNISIQPSKAFVGYPSVKLLGQKVNSLGLSTAEDKLLAISRLSFPKTLRELETYLGLTGWLRNYVPHYAAVTKPLQDRKTELLKPAPKSGNSRKSFSTRTKLEPSMMEEASFRTLQELLSKPTFLTHFDTKRVLYIDLDASKQFGFGAMVYHAKSKTSDESEGSPKYPARTSIEPIMFLSRLARSAETRYWPTELEMAGLVWVVKKVRHLIESSNHATIIHTDHSANVGIARQTSLSTSSTNKLNLRLVNASEYLQRFNLDIRHKPGKMHIVPDALSRLANADSKPSNEEGELDALYAYGYTATLAELSEEFKKSVIDGYKEDPAWAKTLGMLENNVGEDAAKIPFERGSDGLVWHVDRSTGDHAYQYRRLAIPSGCVKEVFNVAHTQASHPGFQRTYEKVTASFYIRGLSRAIRTYLQHCPECLVYQTRRHQPHGSMQPIDMPPVPFHTLTLDFVLALPLSSEGYNTILSVTDKFSKRITLIPGKATHTGMDWATLLLERLQLADWGLPKVILSDRDRKFLSELWTGLFSKLGVRLLYSTAYHPQTDGQSERTNQTTEIALRFYIGGLENATLWPSCLGKIQSELNNARSASTMKTPNEIVYGFTLNQPLDLVTNALPPLLNASIGRIEAKDAIDFANVEAKLHYDRKHHPLFLRVGEFALLRLHKGYNIPTAAQLGRKLGQQYAGPFKVLERVGRLAYRLDIPVAWRIHPVFSVAHLEPCPPPGTDPYERPIPAKPSSVYVEGDTDTYKSYEVERLLDRRVYRKGKGEVVEYLVRWLGYGPEDDQWLNLKDLGDSKDLVADYNRSISSSLTGTTVVAREPLLPTPSIPSSPTPIPTSTTTLATTSRTITTPITTTKKRGRPKKNLAITNTPATPTTSTALVLRDGNR